jgi:type 2 lantibiotic biosynthesis protein LanM
MEKARFLEVIGPLFNQGRDRLRAGVEALSRTRTDLPFDPHTVEEVLGANLPRRLIMMLSGTIALELQVARLQGVLQGETSAERFQSFVDRVCQREHALALFREYPVLARQVLLRIDNWVAVSLEFLQRLCADWEALRTAFSPAKEPGVLVQVSGGMGDAHRGERAVLIATFSSGFQVVYKPRPLAVDVHFQELLTWLNQHGDHPPFRTVSILDRGTYGWVPFVAAQGCTSVHEVRRFYQRQGGYLALLYALEATDFHFENLIAAGEQPVLVDLETLFHPRAEKWDTTQADQRAEYTLASSVMRVGLLPLRRWPNAESDGIDLSGLGAVAGQPFPRAIPYWEEAGTDEMRLTRKRIALPGGQHRPSLQGTDVNVLDYIDDIVAGFTAIYHLLQKHREELLSAEGPLARFAADAVRVLLRPTQNYATVLRESFHPDVLRRALDRDRLFDWLWVDVKKRPELVKVIRAEQEDLHRGDIPLFTTRPISRDVWSSTQERIADFFGEPGMVAARRRVQQLSEQDLKKQLWFIRASLATLSGGAEPVSRSTLPRIEPQTSEPKPGVSMETRSLKKQLLAAAGAVGDRLEALALRGTHDVTWVGMTTFFNERQWAVRQLGVDVAEGLPGVILFLAHLGSVTGEERYTTLAHAALTTWRRQVDRNRSALTMIGGFYGWGGVIYTYAHLGALWQQPALWQEVEAIVELLPPLIERDEHLDMVGGAAGCIGSLLALYHCVPAERTLATAVQCGDRLLARAQATGQGCAWVTPIGAKPLTGFAHGAAGIAWSLLKLAALTGEERFRTAADGAIAYERSLFSPETGNWPDLRANDTATGSNEQQRYLVGWCHGAPGIGLARLLGLRHLEDAQTRAEITVALQTTLGQGFGDNHSLCHGDLGNMELLIQAPAMLADSRCPAEVDSQAALILGSIRGNGWRCGTPSNVESPGLMTGLAGIGYGLLRLAAPTKVPAVLVLAPPLCNG